MAGQRGNFCCYGCALALQITRARGDDGAAAAILIRVGLAIFFAVNVMMVSMPTYAPYVYGADATTDGALFQVLRVLALVLAVPVLVLLGGPILATAASGLRSGAANTDSLIVLGTIAAYVLSVVNTVKGRSAVYFDTVTMLLVLVTLGRYLEAQAKAAAGAAMEAGLAPAPAFAVRLSDGIEQTVLPESLRVDDLVRVTPGDAFPTDGVILGGIGGVDESALTGEGLPVTKKPDSTVASGTCSVDGVFIVRVTARAADSAAGRIASLLAAARRERAEAERVADRVASVLLPAVMIIATAAAGFWAFRTSIDHGLLVGLAVLVVACPCGLGLATPVAVWTGLATAARHGVIVRTAPALERAATLDRVLFDKTGTLTESPPRLMAVEAVRDSGLSADNLLARAAALEAGLTHPLARAIAEAWRGVRLCASDVRVVPGRGVRGCVDGDYITVGSVGFAAEELGGDAVKPFADPRDGGATVLVWQGHELLGALRVTEAVRADAPAAIGWLRRLDVDVGLLSGDVQAKALVPSLIAAPRAMLGLLPEDKLAAVRGQRALAMVGDGINDAPALAAANLGIAVGRATDLARITADVVIVSDDLTRVPWLLAYARRVRRVIRQNLFWVFAYNFAALSVAASGRLNPLIASLAMLCSSLVVIANARRLRAG